MERITYLDLSDTELKELPPEIADLTALKSLYLCKTKIKDISAIRTITTLEGLSLQKTPISDISPISNLTNLRYLDLSHSRVKDISPLEKLVNINSLYLTSTPTDDLSPLRYLKNLELLKISYIKATDITPLMNLKKIRRMWLVGVTPPIKQFEDLVDILGKYRIANYEDCLRNIKKTIGRQLIHKFEEAVKAQTGAAPKIDAYSWRPFISITDPGLTTIPDVKELDEVLPRHIESVIIADAQLSDITSVYELEKLRLLGLRNCTAPEDQLEYLRQKGVEVMLVDKYGKTRS